MEIELGTVQSKTSDAYKLFQKSERRIKELQFQQDEDKKNQDAMSELAQKLQLKIKTYKKQIEEAEEIAALNLAKFRKAQQELEETEDRAKMAQAHLTASSGFLNIPQYNDILNKTSAYLIFYILLRSYHYVYIY